MNLYLLKVKEQYVDYDMHIEMLVLANSMRQARELAVKEGGKIYNVDSMVTCELFDMPTEPSIIYSDFRG